MKALKKILIVLIIGALIAGAFIPMGSVGQISTAPAISIEKVWMNGPTNVTGEYANENHTVMVRVKNTGTEYLKDIAVSCEVFSDAGLTTSVHAYTDMQLASLNIGEEYVFEFGNWSPYMTVTNDAIDNWFWINATVSSMGFMDVMADDPHVEPIVIRNVTNVDWVHNMMFDTMGTIMTPYPYVEEMMPGVESYNYSNAAHTIHYNIINLGNVPATVTVDVSGYDIATSWDADFTDTDTPVVLPGQTTDWTAFTGGTWDVSGFTDGQLNLSVSGADFGPMNATHYFMVNDYTDVKPMMLTTDLAIMYDTTTFNTTAAHNVGVAVLNSGNQDISTDFYTTLTIAQVTGMSTYGPTLPVGTKQLIPAGTTTMSPGDAVPAIWLGVTPPGAGTYQFNATAPVDPSLGEYNSSNNVTSVLVIFDDLEGMDLTLNEPMTGKYPVMSMDINATVTNTGTLNFADYGVCNVSLMVYDTNMTSDTADDVMVWNPALTQIMGLDMTMSEWVDWTWTGAEGGKEYRIVVNSTIGTHIMEKTATVKFPHPNGTVIGTVTPNQAGIEIKAWDGATEILSAMTDASGYYEMSLEAITGMYNLTIEMPPYQYEAAWNDTVMVYDDERTTIVNFDLVMIPGGNVSGTISLVESTDSMQLGDDLDYTDITVEVDGVPRSVMADDVGNYTITGIEPGTVNITASKPGYMAAWNDTVEVVADETTINVTLTLYEYWNVMVDPAHGAMDVPVDTTVTVTFEEDMNKTTINLTNTFDVMDSADTSVPGTIMWLDNMSFEFTPDANLTMLETYTVWIDTGVMSAMDMAVLHREWMSEFTIKGPDILYGTIEGYVTDALTGDAIEGATVTASSVSGTTDAMGMYSIDVPAGTGIGVTATKYKYEDETITGVDVVEAMTTGDQNISMTPIIDISVWVMVDGVKTEVDPDAAALTGVDLDTVVIMKFSEALNETTLDFTLDSVTGTTVWNATDMSATFTPDANLTEGTGYTLTITTDVTNATGAAILPRDVEWNFETMSMPVYWTITSSGPTGTSEEVTVAVTATFSEAMNTTDVEAKFSISPTVAGTFTWSNGNKTFTWAHANDFANNQLYTVKVAKNAKSAAGNTADPALADPSWSFTTKPGKPTETSDLVIGPIQDKDGKGISGATVTLTYPDGTSDTATTNADGVATFTFDELLPSGTYTVKVSKGDYKSKSWDITYDNATDTWSGQGVGGSDAISIEKEDEEDGEFDWLPVILIIIVIIIIVVLLALAMRPKKAAEEELEEEEGEEGEEGAEEEEFECPECGAAVTSGEAVCPECGAEFEEEEFECPECGAKIEGGAGVCPECGAEFETEEEEMEEGEEGEEGEEELEDYEIEEEEEFEEEEGMEGEEMEEGEEGMEEEEELPEDEDEFAEEEEAEEAPEEEEEELD